MHIHSLGKIFIATLALLQLSSCAVVAVGGVAATATVMADRRTPGVQAIDKGIELQASGAFDKKFALQFWFYPLFVFLPADLLLILVDWQTPHHRRLLAEPHSLLFHGHPRFKFRFSSFFASF
jgi:hypothetical protein